MNTKTFLLIFLSIFQCSFASHLAMATNLEEDYKIKTFILPINWSSSLKYNLVVSIPENFKPLQDYSSFGSKEATMLEFVPENQDANSWTSIITLHKFLGRQLSAEKFLQQLKNTFVLQTQKPRFWNQEIQKNPDFIQASFGLNYLTQDKLEVIGVSYYSGPYDLVGVQYTIRPNAQVSKEEAIKRIKEFLKSLQVRTTNPEETFKA